MKLPELLDSLKTTTEIVIVEKNKHITGEDFYSQVISTSKTLKQLGIHNNTPVLIKLNNSIDSVIILFAIIHAGGVAFLANHFEPIGKTANTIEKFGIAYLVSDKVTTVGVREKLNKTYLSQVHSTFSRSFFLTDYSVNEYKPSKVHPNFNNAQIAIFSSGTTGDPKVILNTFENHLNNAKLHAKAIGLQKNDHVACILPIYYSYGLVASLLASLLVGCTIFLSPPNHPLDADWMNINHITVIALTPFFAQSLSFNTPTLRVITLGGDVLSIAIAKHLRASFPNVELYSTYGLTEAGPRVATWRFDNIDLPSTNIAPLGVPLDGVELSIQSSNNDHKFGELIVTTPTSMIGYYYGTEQEAIIIDNTIATGDIFERINENLHFSSRSKSVIVQNGEKIFPPVIESIISAINGVYDVRVSAQKDIIKGEIASAEILAQDNVSVNDIKKVLLQQLPYSSLPSNIEFVKEISRNFTGKLPR